LYKSGILSAECGDKTDHGVLVVGYGELDGQKYWKVKNSWGAAWGMGGYLNIFRGKPGAGECGIKLHMSYPVANGTSPTNSKQSASPFSVVTGQPAENAKSILV